MTVKACQQALGQDCPPAEGFPLWIIAVCLPTMLSSAAPCSSGSFLTRQPRSRLGADPQFSTIQVCLNDLPVALWQAKPAVNRLHGSGTPGRGGRAMSNIRRRATVPSTEFFFAASGGSFWFHKH